MGLNQLWIPQPEPSIWDKFMNIFSRKERIIVSETSSSTWHYHLRIVKIGEEKYSGGAGPALCGKPLGWDTKIPLESFQPGKESHIPESFCQECFNIFQERKNR